LGWYKVSRKKWQAQSEARVVTLEALLAAVQNPCIVCGEFPAEVRQQILNQKEAQLVSPAGSVRRPAVLAELAWARWQSGDTDEEASLAPIYIHVAEPLR
jgi:tRNA threonylcarbamoyladenosine biosynthesis protein TsaB